jgi:DNA-binding response OmpR family regulator
MVSALICTHSDLEKDLGQTMLWRQDVDRHAASRLEEARMMALAARPSIVVVDRDLPWAGRLVSALREDGSTRRLSIVVVARGDFDPGEIELLEAGANAILRVPFDTEVDVRLQRLVDVPVRKSARFSVSFTVETYGAGTDAQPALALNLSLTGILMDVSVPLPVGQPLELHFPLGGERPAVRVRGRVQRVAPPSHYGIEFTDVDESTAERLRQFLDGLEQA